MEARIARRAVGTGRSSTSRAGDRTESRCHHERMTWTYDRGPREFIRILHFKNGARRIRLALSARTEADTTPDERRRSHLSGACLFSTDWTERGKPRGVSRHPARPGSLPVAVLGRTYRLVGGRFRAL